jgi:hypothetical protein
MRLHPCPACAHVVKVDHPTPLAVEHLPDGRHTYSILVKVGQSWGGKRA